MVSPLVMGETPTISGNREQERGEEMKNLGWLVGVVLPLNYTHRKG